MKVTQSVSTFLTILTFVSISPTGTKADGGASAVQVTVVQESKDRWHLEALVEAPFSKKTVWKAITDYDHIADYVPNVAYSHLTHRGEALELEQIGQMRFLVFRITAPVTFKVSQNFDAGTIDHEAIRGKFRRFTQHWAVSKKGAGSEIRYRAEVQPAIRVPQWVIKWRIKKNVENSFSGLLTQMAKNSDPSAHSPAN